MTSFQVLYHELVQHDIPDDIIKIIFNYAKCQHDGCYEFGDEELITFEEFGIFDGFYCYNHLDEIIAEIEELLAEFNSYTDDEYDDDRFMGWDFGASVDI